MGVVVVATERFSALHWVLIWRGQRGLGEEAGGSNWLTETLVSQSVPLGNWTGSDGKSKHAMTYGHMGIWTAQ